MTLSFTQTINGKPNYFIEKIWAGYTHHFPFTDDDWFLDYRDAYQNKFGKVWDQTEGGYLPDEKIHTIRLDPHNRWRAGINIHPVINNRTPNRFQFAPTIKCESVQRIDIKDVSHLVGSKDDKWIVLGYPVKDVVFNLAFEVKVDGRAMDETVVEQIAVNDGFNSTRDFLNYFQNGIENGKLIHWTDSKY